MRAVIQRVKNSNVKVDNKVVGSIMKGYTILLGVTHNDSIKDIKWLCNIIIRPRHQTGDFIHFLGAGS